MKRLIRPRVTLHRPVRFTASVGLAITLAHSTAAHPEPQDQSPEAFVTVDFARLETIGDPVFAPDGDRIYYALTDSSTPAAQHSDLWVADWNGGSARQITATRDASEWQPSPSRDGRKIVFLSDGGKGSETQLWIIPAKGGTARQITHIPGGISDYALSPDGQYAAVVAETGSRVASTANPLPPIVIDRFQSKQDGRGWLDDRRQQLFRIDLRSGAATQLTHGGFDQWLPSWSPDGKSIAFVSKRCPEADRHYCSDVYVMPASGGDARRISPFEGGDGDPDFEAGRPQWSPDSQRLLWVRAGDETKTWYTPFQLAVADLATGAITHPAWIDRWFYFARWSDDGSHILALVEQDRDTWLAEIDPERGTIRYRTQGRDFATGFAAGPKGRIAVVAGGPDAPPELRTVEPTPRVLTRHNGWLAKRRPAVTRDVSWMSDGVEIHGMLVLPPGEDGSRPLPTIVRLHGGPVYQFSHEFMLDWQIYAAHGYAVFAPNPRGSSGRGADFAQAQMAKWGTVDVDDVRRGIDKLVAQGVIDPDRIGVGGWSYGGILTDYMIASDPRIKAAVSGAGMGNFLGGFGVDQYARDYLLELGAPWDRPEFWLRLSYPFFNAPKIKTPTLFLCAQADDNVPCSGGQQMYQALRTLGVPSRLVIYPGENHGLVVPSYLEDRMQRHLDWYDRFLGKPGQN